MKRGSSVLLLVLALLFPRAAWAGDEYTRVSDVPPGEDHIESVSSGDKAPFAGQLFDSATALRWANWLSQYRLKLKQLEVLMQARAEIDQKFHAQQVQILTASHANEVAWYRAQLQLQTAETERLKVELQNPPFYKTTWFGFAAGVVAVSLSIGVGAVIVGAGR